MFDSRSLVLTLPLLLLAGCEFEGGDWHHDRFKEDFHQSHPLKSGQRISLESFNGSVEIMGWEKDEVDVTAVKYASSKDYLDQLRIDVKSSADAVRIRAERPADRSWRGGMGVKFVIRVPKKTELERIETTNGSIRIEGVDGASRLRSTNGSVRASRINGSIDATTTNGSIELTGTVGDAVLHTTNGSVRADDVRGAFDANTTNGAVRARINEPLGKAIRAHTSNGSITIQLPTGLKAELRARTSNSSISSDFEVVGSKGKHRLDGTINGGGPLVDLSTSNGAIRVERL